MATITFGYSDSEDRIWMLFRDDGIQLWLTRRLTGALLAQTVSLMTDYCPQAGAGASLPAATRIALEHEAAHEPELDVPGAAAAAESAVPNVVSHRLGSVDLTVSADLVAFDCQAPGLHHRLQVDRAGAHRMLRAIAERARLADWALPGLPAWLG